MAALAGHYGSEHERWPLAQVVALQLAQRPYFTQMREVGVGEAYASTRREALQAEQTRAAGTGNLRSTAPGYLLTLSQHPRAERKRPVCTVLTAQREIG